MSDVATESEPKVADVVEPVVEGESQESIAAEVAEAEKAAEQFFPSEVGDVVESTEPKAEPTPVEEKKPEAPKIGAEWIGAAKGLRFTNEEIAAFKDDRDAEFQIQTQRFRNLRDIGIDPRELIAFRQAQQQQQPTQPVVRQAEIPPAPTAAKAVEDLKLEIDEQELAPELVTSLRATEKYVNQLKETLGTENARLRQELTGVQGAIQQRAEESTAADNEVRFAAQWDATAKATPNFVEEFGLPSEVKRLPPDDPRVLKISSLDPYVQAAWRRHAFAVGGNQNVSLQNVVADAFKQFIEDRGSIVPGTTAKAQTNGTQTTQPGSVVRSSSRQAPVEPKSDGTGVDINDALSESMKAVSDLWDAKGGNPFAGG